MLNFRVRKMLKLGCKCKGDVLGHSGGFCLGHGYGMVHVKE